MVHGHRHDDVFHVLVLVAVLSTLAFGALSPLAAPTSPVENALAARCDCDSVPTIFAGVQADIQVNLDALCKPSENPSIDGLVLTCKYYSVHHQGQLH